MTAELTVGKQSKQRISDNVNKQVGYSIKLDIAILQVMVTSVTKAIMITLVK